MRERRRRHLEGPRPVHKKGGPYRRKGVKMTGRRCRYCGRLLPEGRMFFCETPPGGHYTPHSELFAEEYEPLDQGGTAWRKFYKWA